MSKTVLITGATSGLGKATAEALLQKGYHLILVGRSNEALLTVKEDFLRQTPQAQISIYRANFSLMAEVHQLADVILKDTPKIDVLINNAGAVYSEFQCTAEGYERTIATNHLSYFILTLKLLPLLVKETGRIVNVASDSHRKAELNFKSFQSDEGYFIMKAYGQSKLANIMFTYSLAEKIKHLGITVNALNPGRVKTSIGGKSKHWLHQWGWNLLTRLTGISIEQGIKTHLLLADDPSLNGITGRYYNQCKEMKSNTLSYDKHLQEQLWKWSEEVTQVSL